MLELVFVLAGRQNHFFVELVHAIRYELDELGVRSSVFIDGFPEPQRGKVFVLVPPHEYFALEGNRHRPDDDLLRRTVFIGAEQPGTSHFEENARLAGHAGAVFDINPWAAREYTRRGIKVDHLAIGHSRFWDRPDRDTATRDVDVLFMGCSTPRRERYLASYAPSLSRRRSKIILSDNSGPNHRSAQNFLVGKSKMDLLARSRVLLNIHQGHEPYFEWLRVIEAIHAGCVVVSEHSVGVAPLVPDRHLVTGRAESLGLLGERLLEDPDLLERVREEAYTFVRENLPLRSSVALLVERAMHVDTHAPVAVFALPAVDADDLRPAPGAPTPPSADVDILRMAMKEVRLDLLDLRRDLTLTRQTIAGTALAPVRVVWESPGRRVRREPRVSIVTALYNHSAWIADALASVPKGTYQDFEIIVVDDGSTDASLDAVVRWGMANRHVPLLVLNHPVNRGLPHARNTAIDFARGEYVLPLDADNDLLTNCLDRLVAALDADPGADFAYGMLACFDSRGYLRLISQYPWDPPRLRAGNYIDALAMLRRSTLRLMGGYTTDRRLYGWEDYDLYCRMAEAARRGVLVAEMVARYRVSPTSMLSLTNLSHVSAFIALREHCPVLMGLEGPVPLSRADERTVAALELDAEEGPVSVVLAVAGAIHGSPPDYGGG